jgi:hypothetical protein
MTVVRRAIGWGCGITLMSSFACGRGGADQWGVTPSPPVAQSDDGGTWGGSSDSGDAVRGTGPSDSGRSPPQPDADRPDGESHLLSDGGGVGCSAASTLICDDFEKYDPGTTPGAPWTNSGAATVSTDRAYSGTRSLLAAENQQLLFALPSSTDVVYGRVMFYAAAVTDQHWGWTNAHSGNDTFQLGQQTAYGTQELALYFDGTGGETGLYGSTIKIPLGQWVCMEWSMDRKSMSVWQSVNGHEIPEFVGAKFNGSPVSASWDTVTIGQDNCCGSGGPIYIDDVGFGTERIGCP